MGFIDQMLNSSTGQGTLWGAMSTLGFEPVGSPPKYAGSWAAGLLQYDFVPGSAIPHLAEWSNPSYGMLGLGVMSTGINAAVGYHDNGFTGAVDYTTQDIAAQAAAYRYHTLPHRANTAAGVVVRPGIFSNAAGSSITNTKRVMNSIAWGGRAIVGGGIGGAIGSGVGGYMGSSLGAPGEFAGSIAGGAAGAYVGAAAIGNPVVMGGLAVAAGATAVGAAGVGAVGAAGYGTYQVLRAGYRHKQMQRGIQTSGSMAAFSTRGAYTMRARAVQAIHKSHLNARSALGQEASYLHFPSRSYHSRYRRHY